ncbi:hypothetical protein HK104_004730 [Borealophlyctis nickersoniae]|nr:hypothetical protein HK104_004730 [Borealophlyctis nickersoniae]
MNDVIALAARDYLDLPEIGRLMSCGRLLREILPENRLLRDLARRIYASHKNNALIYLHRWLSPRVPQNPSPEEATTWTNRLTTIFDLLLTCVTDVRVHDDMALRLFAAPGAGALAERHYKKVHDNCQRHRALDSFAQHAVRALLDRGADPHACYEAPFLDAVRYGHTAVVAMLLECTPSLGRRSCALTSAVHYRYDDMVKLLVQKAGADAVYWALRDAVDDRSWTAFKTLLSNGTDVHFDDDRLLSDVAARDDVVAPLMLLLHAGANVHARGGLALKRAMDNDRPANVQLLLSYGAEVDVEAFERAVVAGRRLIVLSVIAAGKPIPGDLGRLAQVARAQGDTAVADLLGKLALAK